MIVKLHFIQKIDNIASGIREEKQHLTIHLDGKKIALRNPEHLQIYEL